MENSFIPLKSFPQRWWSNRHWHLLFNACRLELDSQFGKTDSTGSVQLGDAFVKSSQTIEQAHLCLHKVFSAYNQVINAFFSRSIILPFLKIYTASGFDTLGKFRALLSFASCSEPLSVDLIFCSQVLSPD